MNKLFDIANMFSFWGGKIICFIFDVLILNYNGSFLSLSNLHNTNVSLDKKKYTFTGKYKMKCDKNKYLYILNKLKKLDIFVYKIDNINLKTILHKKNNIIKQDDLIAITTNIYGNTFYTTSYEKVAILEETINSLILCITTCSENVVNGFYRFTLKYNVSKQQIHMKYSKVQSFTTLPLRCLIKLNENSYIESNKISIMNTFNYLFQDKIITTNDVNYIYK